MKAETEVLKMAHCQKSNKNMEIAVLLPCYNEEVTIAKVIRDFQAELPDAKIYVYDNNSKDRSFEISVENGAIVRKEFRQGKGNVIRSMFRDIEADVYIMADADDTYPAEYCHKMIELIVNGEADMAMGDRLSNGAYHKENKRAFHSQGNILVRALINLVYRSNISDIMTGYRCFNRKFVKTAPLLSAGFEIETEMTLHALDKRFLIKEIPVEYRDRPEGSTSKLNTFSDGFKVLYTIFALFKNYKPLVFFSALAGLLMIMGLSAGAPVIREFLETGFIRHLPLTILAAGLVIISMLFFICGVILDTIARNSKYVYELISNQIISQKNK